MKKEEADAFLDEWEDEVGKTVPSEHFPIEVLREQEIVLEFFKQMFDEDIADYSLDRTIDTIDLEDGRGWVRVFWFSKGMNDYFVAIDSSGFICGVDNECPSELLISIHNSVMAVLLTTSDS